jgi:hypothetical protein
MTPTLEPPTARFIREAKEQLRWLKGELARPSLASENYESDQRAIRAAMRELNEIICYLDPVKSHENEIDNHRGSSA